MIVIHTTEGSDYPGLLDLKGLGGYFDRPETDASSHVANDREGYDARYVLDREKAWTCSVDNAFTLNLEQIARASTKRAEWYERRAGQLHNTAEWIAYWSKKHDIPIRRGVAPAGVLLRKGVASHKQLGLLGGGHWDPGPSYPMRYVLLLARWLRWQRENPEGSEMPPRIRRIRKKLNGIRAHYRLNSIA